MGKQHVGLYTLCGGGGEFHGTLERDTIPTGVDGLGEQEKGEHPVSTAGWGTFREN